MASLEKRNGSYRIVVRVDGRASFRAVQKLCHLLSQQFQKQNGNRAVRQLRTTVTKQDCFKLVS